MDENAGILIVEDRSIVAGKIKHELERAGFAIAGMASTWRTGARLAQTLRLRAAILDVDLRGEPVFPVASALRRRDVPFVFVTGYGQPALPTAWQDVLLVEKPFEGATLVRTLRAAMAGAHAEPVEERATTPAIRRAWDRMRQTRDILTEQRAWAEQHGFTQEPLT